MKLEIASAPSPTARLASDSGLFFNHDFLSTKSCVPREWAERAQSTPLYALSSFSYSVVGISMFFNLPCIALYHKPPFSEQVLMIEAALLVVQGFFSFLADVVYLSLDSSWHRNDRLLATTLTSVQFLRLFRTSGVPAGVILCYAASLVGAICCFRRSKTARARGVCAHYLLWHGMWHAVLPVGGLGTISVLRAQCSL